MKFETAARDGIGYLPGISTQPQAEGAVAQIGYLAVLACHATGRQVWQNAQAALGADLRVIGTLMLTLDGADRARISRPTGGQVRPRPFPVVTDRSPPSALTIVPGWSSRRII